MAAKGEDESDLADIKRLLMLLLVKLGTPAEEIALILHKSKATVSGMVPVRKIKKLRDES
jgi:hypothetical protein